MTLLPRGPGSTALTLSLCLSAFASELVHARFAEEPQEQPLYANRPPHVFYHNVGLLQLFVSNLGQIGVGNYHLDTFSAGWHGGEYLNVAAPWIAAIAPDNLTYCSTGATPGGRPELLPSPDPVDTVYPAYEGAHGGNRLGFSQNPDDDGDGLTDEDVLNGKDDDRDGQVDEDFAAISQQMYSCEYRDDTDLARRLSAEHRPLGIRIQQRSYAWSTAGANEFVGFDFDIINEGVEALRQVYLGFFVDGDAGSKSESSYFDDDAAAFLGLDTTFVDPSIDYTCPQGGEVVDCAEQRVHLDMMYIHDVPDDGVTAFGGDVSGYFGAMLLGHTTDPSGATGPERVEMRTARYFTKSAGYLQGDPRVDAERYELLASGEQVGRPSTQPGDYRFVLSAGPFSQLTPGERLQLQVAFVIGEGKKGMITNAISAQSIYNGRWRDLDGDVSTGVAGREFCLKALEPGSPVFWHDPCDSLSQVVRTIKQTYCIPQNYVDNDCNCCTPLPLGPASAGSETLVHWVGTVAPPRPTTNLESEDRFPGWNGLRVTAPAGDRRVHLQWDNLSELTADPIEGKVLFGGYRIWRVEGWNRPIGSMGPSAEDWQLLADLALVPQDGLGPDSPAYLPKYVASDFDTNECVATGVCNWITTGADPRRFPHDVHRVSIPVGIYSFVDSLGLKNGMLYFYDVTAYSAWYDTVETASGYEVRYRELESLPAAMESEGVTPRWTANRSGDATGVFVVPNPYIAGQNPAGWDLTPSDADPTGSHIAFASLPDKECEIRIYTLAGDLVQTIGHDRRNGSGTEFWNLVSRNGQQVTAGIYLYSVRCSGETHVGRFTIVR